MAIDSLIDPLTPERISEWLSNCEEDFDIHDSANPASKLTDKQKIQRTVASISRSHTESNKLHTWYTQNRRTLETKNWDTFRDLVKDRVLGKGWRIQLLRNFFTYSQGTAVLEDYFQKVEALKFTVGRSSNLSDIDDMVYKCRVLFGCRPDLVEKFMRSHKNDQQFIQYDVEEIMSVLKDLEGDGSVPTQAGPATQVPTTFQALTAAGLYITSGLFGGTISTTGTDVAVSNMVALPDSSTAVGHVSQLYCYYNDVSARPQIQLIQVMSGDSASWKNCPVDYHNTTKNILITFSAGEYLTQVTMTREHSFSAISSMSFLTSRGKEYMIGSTVGEKRTFTAPSGWRVVGFHGTAGSYVNDSAVPGGQRWPITRLGVIYAPVLP